MNATIHRLAPNLWSLEFMGDDGTVKLLTGDSWEAVGRKLARVVRRRGRGL